MYVQYSSVFPNAVGVTPAAGGKGVVLSQKNPKASPQAVAHRFNSTKVRGGARRVAGVVSRQVSATRPDLYKPAVSKAQAILRAQNGGPKPRPGRKVHGTKKPVLVVNKEEESA